MTMHELLISQFLTRVSWNLGSNLSLVGGTGTGFRYGVIFGGLWCSWVCSIRDCKTQAYKISLGCWTEQLRVIVFRIFHYFCFALSRRLGSAVIFACVGGTKRVRERLWNTQVPLSCHKKWLHVCISAPSANTQTGIFNTDTFMRPMHARAHTGHSYNTLRHGRMRLTYLYIKFLLFYIIHCVKRP